MSSKRLVKFLSYAKMGCRDTPNQYISYKKKGPCQTLMHAVHTQAHTHAEDKELHSTYELYPHPSISYEKTGCHDTLNQLLYSLRKEGDLSNPHA